MYAHLSSQGPAGVLCCCFAEPRDLETSARESVNSTPGFVQDCILHILNYKNEPLQMFLDHLWNTLQPRNLIDLIMC